jgi:hypothetical protein
VSLYADTGIFIALYLPDRRSQQVQKLVAEFRPRFWVTPLHRAEWSHAVFQKISEKRVSSSEAGQIMAHFDRDREFGRWRDTQLPDGAIERSMALAKEHGSRIKISSSDTLHVASALELKAMQFWTATPSTAALATAVKMVVVTPGYADD